MNDQRTPRPSPVMSGQTRRRVLRGALGAAGGALLLPPLGSFAARGGLLRDDDGGDDPGRDDGDGSGSGSGHSGHGGGDRDDVAEEGAEGAVAVVGVVPDGAIEVRIVSDDAGGFVPGDLTVDAGQAVAFVNAHDDPHTATGSGFDTGVIGPGQVATVVLGEPGAFAYACQIHPEMTGRIGVRGPDGTVPEPAPAAAPPAGAAAVSIANFAFAPATVTVPVGGAVSWTNDDAVPHTATALDGAFDSGIFDPGASFSWTFDAPGEFPYRCNLHPQMLGTVVVSGDATAIGAAGQPAATGEGGGTPAGTDLVGGWVVLMTPDPGADLAAQRALVTFHADGTAEATFAADGPTDRPVLGSGRGVWQADGSGGYQLALVAFRLDAEQRFAGTVTVREAGALDAAGETYRGAFAYDAVDAAGAALPGGGGTARGTAIRLDDANAAPIPVADPGTPNAATAGPTGVTIRDFAFDPPTLEVPLGTEVTWRNDDGAPHTATGADGAFDTGRIDPGQSASQVFDQPGSFAYRCAFHPEMEGTVVVA